MAGGKVTLGALTDWIGREERFIDTIDARPARGLVATLGLETPTPLETGDPLPPGWHWLYFPDLVHPKGISPDGHAARGGFLPPVPLPRRMWAGGHLRFPGTLRIGDRAERVSTIRDVRLKEGRTGTLVFVTVGHTVQVAGATVLEEDQNLVYREAPRADAPIPAGEAAGHTAQWTRLITPDPVMLFRYSALTFNGHRIHYDRNWCREEGYPGLVVHGPLLATLLMELYRAERPGTPLAGFDFRSRRPLFDTAGFSVNGCVDGDHVSLWAAGEDGLLAMAATAHPTQG